MEKKLIYCEYEQKRSPRKNLEDMDWYLPYDYDGEPFSNRFGVKFPEMFILECNVDKNILKVLYEGETLLNEKDELYYTRWANEKEIKLWERYRKAKKLMNR